MRTIELQWDDAKWNAGIAEKIVSELLAGLEDAGSILPDKWMVHGPLIARDYDPDPNAVDFEPITRRLTSLLTGKRVQ